MSYRLLLRKEMKQPFLTHHILKIYAQEHGFSQLQNLLCELDFKAL